MGALAAKAIASAKRISKLEVERKFMPSPHFKAQLLDGGHGRSLTIPDRLSAGPTCTLEPQPGSIIRDVYYDNNDKLNRHGIWLRQRRTRGISTAPPTRTEAPEVIRWEAKVKVAGDYNKSQFTEIEGRLAIEAELSRRLPGLDFSELAVMADIESTRLAWSVRDQSCRREGTDPAARVGITGALVTLDECTAPGHVLWDHGKPFWHEVGEIELVRSVMTEAEEDHEAARRWTGGVMAGVIDAFMARHPALFPAEPQPMGKLTAYFAWRSGLRKG